MTFLKLALRSCLKRVAHPKLLGNISTDLVTNKSRYSSTLSCDSSSAEDKPLPFSAIPGPKGTFSNLFEYARNGGAPKFFQTLRKRFDKFGPIFREELFGRRLVNVSHVDTMSKVIRLAESPFPMRSGFEFVDKLNDELGQGTGLMSNERERWYRDRSQLSFKMLRPNEVKEGFPGFNDVASDFIKRVYQMRQADGTVSKLEQEAFYWGVESISTFLFNRRLGFYVHPVDHKAAVFVNTVNEVFECMGKLMFGLPLYKYINTPTYNRFRKSVMRMYEVGQDILESKITRKGKQGEKNFLEEQRVSVLEHIYACNEFSPQTVVNIFVALMAAGVDTTATTILWVLYELSRHPQAQEKLYQELKSVLGTQGVVTKENIQKLPFLKACLKESLRRNPTASAIPRKFAHDIDLLGYNIPAGVDIIMFTHIESNREEYFGEDAKEFVPERWLRDETGKKQDYDPFAALSFGHGVRSCIGRRVAEAEMYVLLSKLVLNFHLEYAGEGELDQRMFGGLLKPDGPVLVKFIPR